MNGDLLIIFFLYVSFLTYIFTAAAGNMVDFNKFVPDLGTILIFAK